MGCESNKASDKKDLASVNSFHLCPGINNFVTVTNGFAGIRCGDWTLKASYLCLNCLSSLPVLLLFEISLSPWGEGVKATASKCYTLL